MVQVSMVPELSKVPPAQLVAYSLSETLGLEPKDIVPMLQAMMGVEFKKRNVSTWIYRVKMKVNKARKCGPCFFVIVSLNVEELVDDLLPFGWAEHDTAFRNSLVGCLSIAVDEQVSRLVNFGSTGNSFITHVISESYVWQNSGIIPPAASGWPFRGGPVRRAIWLSLPQRPPFLQRHPACSDGPTRIATTVAIATTRDVPTEFFRPGSQIACSLGRCGRMLDFHRPQPDCMEALEHF